MEFLSIRCSFYLINDMRALVKYKEWRLYILNFSIWIVILRSVECYVNHLSHCRHLLNARSLPAYSTDDRFLARLRLAVGPTPFAVCPLTIWCRLNYRWVFCRRLRIFWGEFLIPPQMIIDQWCEFIYLRGLSIFGLAPTIGLQNNQ